MLDYEVAYLPEGVLQVHAAGLAVALHVDQEVPGVEPYLGVLPLLDVEPAEHVLVVHHGELAGRYLHGLSLP